MNHLCGLSNLDDDGDNASHLHNSLVDSERDVLGAFQKRYQAALFEEYTTNKNDNIDAADEEKKDSSSLTTEPEYEISEDRRILQSPSGLRPLDGTTLYRYLLADRRGDDFDAEASYRRLLAALKFRRERNVDAIVRHVASSDIPSEVRKCQRLRVGIWAGVDRRCRPVVFERLGQFFGSGNVGKVSSEEDWVTSYLYFLETHFLKMRESAQQSGKIVDRIVYFADFQGIVSSILNRKIWKVVPLLKLLVKTVECHYPEIVDHIVLFNVPRVASAVYNFVKGFLDEVTAEKIELFPGVPYERFKELMSEEVIPKEYGGKNEIEYPQTASS